MTTATLAQSSTHQIEILLIIVIMRACQRASIVGLKPSEIKSDRHSDEHSRIDGTHHYQYWLRPGCNLAKHVYHAGIDGYFQHCDYHARPASLVARCGNVG